MASDLLNTVLDSVLSRIYDHETEIEQRYNELIASGMSDRQAWQQALKEKMEETGWSFLGGALSGGLMAGGRVVTNLSNQSRTGKQARTNGGAKQLYDMAMNMGEDTNSRQLASQIQLTEEGEIKAKDYEIGRLAQALMSETGDQYNKTVRGTVEKDIKEKLNAAGIYRNADEYAKIIADSMTGDGKMSARSKRTLAKDARAIEVWKKYNMPGEYADNLNSRIREATKAETAAQKSVAEAVTGRKIRSYEGGINLAGFDEIREAERNGAKRTGGKREVLINGQFAKLDSVRVVKEGDSWKLKLSVNGKDVNASDLQATDYGTAQIIRNAAVMPEFYGERFTNQMLEAQEKGRLKSDNILDDLQEAGMVRLAGYAGIAMPQTTLDRQLAGEIWAESLKEHAENRKAQVAGANRKESGTVSFDGDEYGTEAYNKKVSKLDGETRAKLDYVAGIVQRAGVDARFTDLSKTDTTTYGWENKKGIGINIGGLNYGTIEGKSTPTGKHDIVVTFGHELTHWLQRNSLAGYNRLEQYIMNQFAQQRGLKGLRQRLDYFMTQEGLSLEDAMSEVVANGSDQILGDEQVAQHIQQTDGKLYTQIKNFVQNLVDRMKKAITGTSMQDSMSRDARVIMVNGINDLRKRWLGAWDEALTKASKVTTEETKTTEDQGRKSQAEIDNQIKEDNNKYKNVDLSTNETVYSYDFLTNLHPINEVQEGKISNVIGEDQNINEKKLAQIGMDNARNEAGGTEEGNVVIVRNEFTGRPLVISKKGIVHSVHTDNNSTNRANARIAQKAGELAKYAVPINALINESDADGTYAMAAPVLGEDGQMEKVAVLTIEIRSGNLVKMEEYDQLHAVSGRKKNGGRNERGILSNGLSANHRSGRISIADFLKEINSTHKGLLSQNVLDVFNEKKPEKGYWPERSKFSKADTTTMTYLRGKVQEHVKINNEARDFIYQKYGINEGDILFGIEFNDNGTVNYKAQNKQEAELIRQISKEDLKTLRELQEDNEKWRRLWTSADPVEVEDYLEKSNIAVGEPELGAVDYGMDNIELKPQTQERYEAPVKREGDRVTLNRKQMQMDAEYLEAVNNQDYEKAEKMILDKYKMIEMTTFGDVVGYNSAFFFNGDHAEIAKAIKEGDPEVVRQAAEEMAPKVPENAVLIPIPPHTGTVTDDTDTMILAKAISEVTGRPVVNALKSEEHTSRRIAKETGERVAAPDLGMQQIADIPKGTFPVFIDNVVGGAVTAKAARDAIGYGITLAYAQSSRGKIQGAKYLSVTRDADGNVIPLSKRIDPNNSSWKYSQAEEALDAGVWMANLTPSAVQTEDERVLMQAYKDKRISISLCLKRQIDYKAKIRELESKESLTGEQRTELENLQDKLEKQQERMTQLEKEMQQITSSEGYAGMMYRYNMVLKDFVQGRTSEQVRDTVEAMLNEVKAAQEQITRRAEELKNLEQTQAVKAMKSFMGKTSLGQQASMLRKQYNSTMNKAEVEDRLAAMALKLASGQDIQTDAEALAADLVDKIRGIRSENLESLRGMTLNIGESLRNELKAENSSMKEIRGAIYGSGLVIKAEGNSRLTEQWNELRENNKALPDIDGMAEIDALHTIVDFISGELQASRGSEQYNVNMEEATAICYGAAASVTTYLVKDPAARKQITELMTQIKDLSRRTGSIAEGMDQLNEKMQEVVKAGYKAADWTSILQNDVHTAIDYYNKVARQAAQEEKAQVKKNLIEQLRSENARKLYEQQDKYEELIKNV